ncbi:hypothetical protein PHYSODRAFT_343170 [Phytophthora sojae]|uniref:Uncharacterized protein n=1 Tax=Phytophthora sojae (strain P6497) TaxID=1094619 RepID=G5AIV0_PHYSP|nr:hypothetical protein PHYSODRAFT_343170 [Phytophthora sojae]EGZ04563.1 hypothetical protein PHYSODRAFT_343170 [Phytophthora sojae]|eukprot:XP_009540001.1 hypothetical protein PHYSODRAFT_343170 [Phytophthora sojae]
MPMLRTSSRVVRRCRSARPSPARRSFSSRPEDWLGIDDEYLSMRGLAIASRVLNGMTDFVRYSRANPRVFVSGASDEVRSSMYVLSQFPTHTRVDLPGFVRGAERAANTVLHRLYAQDQSETKQCLDQLATPESVKSKQGRAVLEQLNVNVAALEAVEYTRERVEEEVKVVFDPAILREKTVVLMVN